jgi:hypothetical protein
LGKFDCKSILRTMSDYINGDLGESVCSDIEMHLTTCRKCRFHVDAVKYTINLFDEWRADDMPADAEIRLRERLREETGCFGAGGEGGPRGRKASGAASRKKTSAGKKSGRRSAAGKSASGKSAGSKPARKKSSSRETKPARRK